MGTLTSLKKLKRHGFNFLQASFQIREGLVITWKLKKPLGFETAPQMACSRGSYSMTSSKTAFQGRKFDFDKVSKIASKCLRMLPNDVSDVPKWLGTLTRSYIDPRSILKKSKKNHFFEFFSNFEAHFVKEFLIKWVVGGKKIIFFRKSKI